MTFSHLFESVLRPVNAGREYPQHHVDWSVKLIRERFDDTLRQHGTSADEVASLIDKSRGVGRLFDVGHVENDPVAPVHLDQVGVELTTND